MKLTGTAIRFRVTAMVLMVLILVVGLAAYVAIPKEAAPSIEIPIITVSTPFPGASPEEVEALVTFIVERELQGIEGVDEIRSTSREGVSLIVIEFRTDVSMAEANRRVRERVDLARVDLPAEAEEPLVREFNIEDIPVLTVNLVAPYALARLTDLAERLRDELEGLPGVLEARLTGGVRREIQVHVDLTALEGYGLSFEEIVRTIEQENISLPGGSIDVDRTSYQVRVDGRFDDPAGIADLVVRAPDQRPVYVRDVAEVVPGGFADRESYSRMRQLWTGDERGRPVPVPNATYYEAVSVSVSARAGENVLELAEDVRRMVADFPVPAGTEVIVTGDRSEAIALLVTEMENHILLGIILVTLSLLFFLGLRSAVLAGISIPLTMMLTFAIFYALGETMNFIVLFALIVVLGILVDFSIVVVENIQRQVEEGYGSWEAALRAAEQVGWPVTAGLTTTMVVFLPLLFWDGIIGAYMRYLPLTLIITLTSALFVALTMIPVAAGYLLGNGRTGPPPERRRLLWRRAAATAAVFVSLVILMYNPVTLVAVALLAGGGYLLHRYVLSPGTSWFRSQGLPRVESRYRELLSSALLRDYDVPRAHLRNAAALVAFIAGCALVVVGGLLFTLLGLRPALVALAPGGVLLALGALAVLVHFLETLFLGGRWSVRVGIALGVLILPFLLVRGVRGDLDPRAFLSLLFLPGLLIAVGGLGAVFAPRHKHLLLTDNRARVLNLTVGGVLAVVVAYAIGPTGASFFPNTDPDQIRIEMEAPGGTSLDAGNQLADRAVERVERLIAADRAVSTNVKNIVVEVGVVGMGPFGGGQPDARRSRITVNLIDHRHRAESSRETMRKFRETLTPFPGAVVRVEADEMGPPAGMPVEVEITGPEFGRVFALSMDAERRLREAMTSGELEGMVDLVNTAESGSAQLMVQIDRERASLFGLSTAEIARTVRAAVEGMIAGQHREGEDEYDIRVRLREEDRQTLESLQALTLHVDEARIPLLAVADLLETTGPGSITRVDLRPVVALEADVVDGYTTGAVLARVDAVLAPVRAELPEGYSLRFAGEVEEQEEAFGFLGFALALGVALMALVLVAKFNSIVVPIIILGAVLLTMSGVVIGLIVTGAAFSIMTFLAVISLAGIVADDDIVLSEFILGYAESERTPEEAVVAGGVSRFRQVVLTAVTTIIGLIPLTFGFHLDFRRLLTELRPGFELGSANSQFWGPLGSAVIWGLPAATAVTLFVAPVVFSVVFSMRRRVSSWLDPHASRD